MFLCPCFRVLTDQSRRMQLCFTYYLLLSRAQTFYRAYEIRCQLKQNRRCAMILCFSLIEKIFPVHVSIALSGMWLTNLISAFPFIKTHPGVFSFLLRNMFCLLTGSFLKELSRTFTHAHYLLFMKIIFWKFENDTLVLSVVCLKKLSLWKCS